MQRSDEGELREEVYDLSLLVSLVREGFVVDPTRLFQGLDEHRRTAGSKGRPLRRANPRLARNEDRPIIS